MSHFADFGRVSGRARKIPLNRSRQRLDISRNQTAPYLQLPGPEVVTLRPDPSQSLSEVRTPPFDILSLRAGTNNQDCEMAREPQGSQSRMLLQRKPNESCRQYSPMTTREYDRSGGVVTIQSQCRVSLSRLAAAGAAIDQQSRLGNPSGWMARNHAGE